MHRNLRCEVIPRPFRQELHGSTIHVACVHPGGIRTNITRNARHHLREGLTFPKERLVRVFEKHLAKVTPEEAAEVIVEGVVAKRKRILIGKDARLFDFVARVFPDRLRRTHSAL